MTQRPWQVIRYRRGKIPAIVATYSTRDAALRLAAASIGKCADAGIRDQTYAVRKRKGTA